MAAPPWLRNLSAAFKAHRLGRTGWYLEVNRERLRVVSTELPPRPGEVPDQSHKRRAFTLQAAPGPATSAAALSEACGIFDAVMAGAWSWPDPDATPPMDDPEHLQPAHLERLARQLESKLVGEQTTARTWERSWAPFMRRLVTGAAERRWGDDAALLGAYLRHWDVNTRHRQLAHDRARRLWKEAGWPWPEDVAQLRGNGKAAADPRGVRSFTDAETELLRERIMASAKLTAADLVAWDCVIVFGLRPQELIGLELKAWTSGIPMAVVSRLKRSSQGTTRPRRVPAVPPASWPADCFRLLARWRVHGLPNWSQSANSPGSHMTQQLRRLHLPGELTAYGCRHAFALRLGVELSLSVREAAELMGHSPAVHLAAYGRRIDAPKLQDKVAGLVKARAAS
jgi:integrase